MRSLFGVRIETLAVALTVGVGLAIAIVVTLAVRNRIFLRLGIRNAARRKGRSALIVTGLMLATAIIAAALGTGDTMGRSVRSTVLRQLGASDEWITTKGVKPAPDGTITSSASLQVFDESIVTDVERAVRGTGLVDGLMPAIVRSVAVQDVTSRQTEPRVTVFAPDPTRMRGFGVVRDTTGSVFDLTALRAGEVAINDRGATALGAHVGDHLTVMVGTRLLGVRVAKVVQYSGTGTAKAALLLPLARAQAALDARGRIEEILVSNRGGEVGGAALTSAVMARLRPVLDTHGLVAQDLKQKALDAADKAGQTFMTMFSTFGSFSIAAGILLIFLIFVMLAAERRTEMGVERAIGTQRGHLVQTFVFEGAAYDLVAAAIGALLGIAVSFAMVFGIARAFTTSGIDITYSVRWQSVVIAYALGVLITFAVVAASAWRVSVLNIVTAVRNLPDPPKRRRGRRRLAGAAVALSVGTLLVVSGRTGAQAMPVLLGASLILVGLTPVLRAFRVPDRVAYTIAGLGIVVLWLLPFRVIESFVPGAQMDFSMWIVGGLLIVLGATWVVMFNADILLGAAMRVFGRIRSLAAVLRISMAYPLRSRLRTGMTFAMFTLVVFTLVVGITTPSSFISSTGTVAAYGGGFDVRATALPTAATADMARAVETRMSGARRDVRAVAAISTVAVQARQASAGVKYVDYPIHGLDATFLRTATYALGSRADGYANDRAVWDALASGRHVAVVDPWIVPHRRKWTFGALTDMTLHGLYAEDSTFRPVPLDIRDPATGQVTRFTVIGVLRDSMPLDMAGVSTSQAALAGYADRATPTSFLFQLAAGVDAQAFAKRLESTFLAGGLQADSFQKLVDDNQAGSMLFLRLIEGFIGLGLVVGVAALGVIAARSVVERRQQIGVLRSIGFQASAVRLGFLLESGFLALTSIVVGTALGLLMSYNVVDDARRQATWPEVHLTIPWANLAVIFVVVMAVALATTYLPARRASRVYAAEALRYE